MRVVVIGSGLLGVTTAYFLRHCGHEVSVVDRCPAPGLETSFANGALLTPSMSDPWNSPGCWRVLLASLTRSDAPLQLHLRTLPTLVRWGTTFLRNSAAPMFERNTLNNLRLALYSLDVLARLREKVDIDYGFTSRGTLRIFRSPAALEQATAMGERLSRANLRFRRLSAAEAAELNPALSPIADQLSGALHYDTDGTGDAHRFCVGLARESQRLGVEFQFGVEVAALRVYRGYVTAVLSDGRRLVADRYVVAAGSYSTELLRHVGIWLPVRPAKGYSVTFHETPQRALRVPIIDDDFHAAVVPLEGAVRVAGMAEFAGFDLSLSMPRVRNLTRLLHEILPCEQFDLAAAKPWCGLRPMSADGVPIIGATPLPNVLVNTGHGHLGWTMAAGSARLLADLMSGSQPAIDPTPFSLARFAAGAVANAPGAAQCDGALAS